MTRKLLSNFKFVYVALLALLFIAVYPSTNTFAKTKKAKHGTIKILTTPGGLLLTIDGKPRGETLTEYRAFDLEPGVHNVVVRLPNGNLWIREIDVPAGRIKCVVVNYKPLPPAPKSPCPFPVNVSAPQSVAEGEIITFAADVNYGGTSDLKYNWVLSPATARIMSGAGTPTITVDSTGFGGQRVEVGWLPVLIQESGNANIQRGARGYFEAASALRLLEVPSQVDRAMGDIHPDGNPHVQLDPHNIQAVAHALSARLSQLDSGQAAYYAARAKDFDARWDAAIRSWEAKAAPLKGAQVVIMHRDQVYLCHWLGLVEVASIEPKPGVPPTAAYLGTLVGKLTTTPAKLILLNAYNDPKAATWLSDRVHVPAVTLPFSVGGSPQAKDLFGLYDDTLNKLLAALK